MFALIKQHDIQYTVRFSVAKCTVHFGKTGIIFLKYSLLMKIDSRYYIPETEHKIGKTKL